MKITQCTPTGCGPSGLARVSNLESLLRHPLSGFFDLSNFVDRSSPARQLVAEITEEQDHYDASFEVPGVKKEDLKIDLQDRLLTVTVTKRDKSGDETKNYTLSRSISVPDSIAADKIAAKLEDGILQVTLPKQESRKPRAIEIS